MAPERTPPGSRGPGSLQGPNGSRSHPGTRPPRRAGGDELHWATPIRSFPIPGDRVPGQPSVGGVRRRSPLVAKRIDSANRFWPYRSCGAGMAVGQWPTGVRPLVRIHCDSHRCTCKNRRGGIPAPGATAHFANCRSRRLVGRSHRRLRDRADRGRQGPRESWSTRAARYDRLVERI
jgi:hypothetical protein